MALTSLGVIEEIHPGMTETDAIIRTVGKRAVYSPEEIEASPKPLMVILFRHHFHLANLLIPDHLLEAGVLKGAPQSITQISDENYSRIKAYGGINGRFTVN